MHTDPLLILLFYLRCLQISSTW